MAPSKTEADHIYLLLSIMEHTEGKINWNKVAEVTGLYKDGKFVRQAFNSIKTKYGSGASGAATSSNGTTKKAATIASTPKSTPKKRGKVNDDVTPAKRSKTKATDEESEDELEDDLEAEA